MDLVSRYHVERNSLSVHFEAQTHWLYRMINTGRPLEEKIALFWHGLFATAWTKCDVYVADWRNDRIQKFDVQGKYLASWGSSG